MSVVIKNYGKLKKTEFFKIHLLSKNKSQINYDIKLMITLIEHLMKYLHIYASNTKIKSIQLPALKLNDYVWKWI